MRAPAKRLASLASGEPRSTWSPPRRGRRSGGARWRLPTWRDQYFVANAGEVNTGAFDPFAAVADLCDPHPGGLDRCRWRVWSLRRRLAPLAHLTHGIERAGSVAADAHKWLNVPYDCGFALVRDVDALRAAFTATGAYMAPDGGRDPFTHVPEMSRRFRALPAWCALKAAGRTGYRDIVERCSPTPPASPVGSNPRRVWNCCPGPPQHRLLPASSLANQTTKPTPLTARLSPPSRPTAAPSSPAPSGTDALPSAPPSTTGRRRNGWWRCWRKRLRRLVLASLVRCKGTACRSCQGRYACQSAGHGMPCPYKTVGAANPQTTSPVTASTSSPSRANGATNSVTARSNAAAAIRSESRTVLPGTADGGDRP